MAAAAAAGGDERSGVGTDCEFCFRVSVLTESSSILGEATTLVWKKADELAEESNGFSNKYEGRSLSALQS